MKNNRLVLFLLISISIPLIAQIKPVKFDRLSTKDGLSQNRVYSIVQDKFGFIWIGTEDGLNRYDGYEFKVYKNIPGDSTSLITNFVLTLCAAKNGNIWIGGDHGLSEFNYDRETFNNYSNNPSDSNSISGNVVNNIDEDSLGNLWVATDQNGFNYFDIHKKIFYRMSALLPPGYKTKNNFLYFIHIDKSNSLWVGGDLNIYHFKVSYNASGVPKLQPLKFANQNNLKGAYVIEEDQNGKIWLGSLKKGLLLYNENQNELKPFKLIYKDNKLNNIILSAIKSDEKNNLWLGGTSANSPNLANLDQGKGIGLYKLDLKNKGLQNYVFKQDDESSLSGNTIISLFKDRTGTLWIGTNLSGLNKYDASVIKFPLVWTNSNNEVSYGLKADGIRGFYEKDNILWIASANGLIAFNKSTKQHQYFTYNPNDKTSISSNIVRSIYDDGQYLWIGTSNGLNRFNPKTKKFKRFYFDSNAPPSQQSLNSVFYDIIELNKMPGYLWYGSDDGLIRFNKTDFTFKKYQYNYDHNLNNQKNFVRVVWYSDSRPNELWLGTGEGIQIFNLKTEKFSSYKYDPKDPNSLSYYNIMSFYEDNKGYVWVSTYGGGLDRFDPKTKKFKRFIESNSDIPNNAVYGVLPDKKGNLWISSNDGISCFNPNTFQFRNYTVDDGLQSEEYNGGAFYENKNGDMYFGGVKGFNVFNPADIVDNKKLPEIEITDIKIFNKSLETGKDSPLKNQVSNTKELVLPYWQNDISFEFVALHYANPSKNQYAYKLENYENDWRYVGHIRTATYTNLDPGKYIFHVKGSNNDGIWNEKGKTLALIILPPWWKTNWAYTGYFLLFVLFVFGVDRFQRHRVIAKERAASAIKEAELRAAAAEAQARAVQIENDRKTKELDEARELQLSMLPKTLPNLPHLDIAVYMKTATEVGGDYYDFHLHIDGTLTFVVGDATGHGMMSGMMVSIMKSLFMSDRTNKNLKPFFENASESIKDMNLGRLMMALTCVQIRNNKIITANAGMPPLYLYRNNLQSVEEIGINNMPLGALKNSVYEVKEIKIESGDTLLLMSDGFAELRNENNELYGYKRAKNSFEKAAQKDPEEIVDFLKNEGSRWTNDEDPDDDVTFVVIKVK